MSQTKKHGPDEKDTNLKREDQRKSYDTNGASSIHGIEFIGGRRITDKTVVSNVKVKKKIPLAVDIIAGILMLALVCGVIVGSYMLFRYYSNDYETRNVTYTVVFTADKELNEYVFETNSELYMDVSGNAVYFGKIDDNSEQGILRVIATVKYRRGEGYSIGNSRLAVGSEYTLRCVDETFSVSVVELNETGGN